MRILMFGWEFPPHITGGLGTACYGLTRALSQQVERIVFVLPRLKAGSGERSGHLELVEAGSYARSQSIETLKSLHKVLDVVEVPSLLQPYMSAEGYEEVRSSLVEACNESTRTAASVLHLSGDYGENLFDEVIRYASVAAEVVRSEKFDVIHVHDWMTCLAGVEASRVSGLPLIFHVHALEFDRCGENIDQRVYEIEWYGLHAANKVIAVSGRTKDIIVSRYGVPAEKVYVVHNGISSLEDHVVRRRIPIFQEPLVVFLGRVTMQKGPEYFLEAAYLVLKKLPQVRFVMAGAGDMLPRMILRMAELGIGEKFHFTGKLTSDERSELFAQAALFVLSSVSEPFGLTPVEALQHDVPVIVTKQSGVSEVLEHALKVDFWDTHRLADGIIKVLSEPELARSMVQGSRNDLKQICWGQAAQKIVGLYREVIS